MPFLMSNCAETELTFRPLCFATHMYLITHIKTPLTLQGVIILLKSAMGNLQPV